MRQVLLPVEPLLYLTSSFLPLNPDITECGDSLWPKKKTVAVKCNICFEDGMVFGEETRKEIQVEVPHAA
jgi:hypothetical protein